MSSRLSPVIRLISSGSLINQYPVLVYTLSNSRTKHLFGNDIHRTIKNFLKFANHCSMFQQAYTSFIKLHKDIDVAQWGLFATSERAKKSCPLDGLALEIVGYCLIHGLRTHILFVYI